MRRGKESVPTRMAAMAAAAAFTLLSAACTTTQGPAPARAVAPEPTADRALPTDIKQILVAGGLDAENPAAPAPRPIAIAAAGLETEPMTEVLEVAAVPPSRQVLMAARSAIARGGVPPRPQLAAVREKAKEAGPRIEQHVSSYAPVVIETSGGPLRLADINMDKPSPSARSAATPRGPKRATLVARAQAPKVRRF